jgi:dipeptidyl-peptidase-4
MNINSMNRLVLLCGLSLCANIAVAQKKQYTMAEATNGIATTLAPKGIKSPVWRPGTHEFYYKDADGKLKMFNLDTKETISVGNAKFTKSGFTWVSKNSGYNISENTLEVSDWETRKDTVLYQFTQEGAKGYSNIHFAQNGPAYAYTIDNDLYYGSGYNPSTAITANPDKNIINGQAVHRNEFGINEGIFFSPKGNYLAYYRMDQTMVEDYPVIDWSVTPAKNENVKYPMAGRTSHQVTLQVYNTATKTTTAIKTEGPKDQYLTCVTWSPDEKYIYIAILNRDQNHLWLNQYDVKTGEKVKTLLQEKDDKYVEPQHPLSFVPGSNTKFIWWSQRDGYMHLWLCDMATNKMTCLTPGNYVVNDLVGFNQRTKEVLLTSAKESPLEKHGYAVNWETGKMRRLDTEPGVHTYTTSEDGAYLYDVFSSESHVSAPKGGLLFPDESVDVTATIVKRCVVRDINGSIVKTLADADNPLASYDRPTIISKTLKASDGTTLYGRLILPTNFDRTKKYPVIVYLYNGPHVQLVKNGFPASGNLWYEYLAQHGYIVWTMDGRGSSNRGMKFEQAIFRHLGTLEMEDHLQGVKFLKSLSCVDTNRLGIHGWSYGGFMTTSMMLRHPGVFKVAVAGGPVLDWSMYEVMYGERYMDTPEQNPEGYKENLLIDKVKNLKGKLMLIHGAQDATVVWQHSIKFLKSAVDNNVQVDYFIYPGYEHNVRGKDRVHLMQKITDYFDQNL